MLPQENSPSTSSISPEEMYLLAAEDSVLFSHEFFPTAFRQRSPAFHADIWHGMESPEIEFFGVECFRGSAKTTIARTCLTKRIAYGLSRTMLVVGDAQAHAVRTVRWVKKQVEFNSHFRAFYVVEKGKKWKDDEIEIRHESLGFAINMVALGITGGTRGLNLDEWRPDFTMVDDPCNEENTHTEEQRRKTNRFFFGSLQPGLAPRSESPHSKMILLQTGLHKKDLINNAHLDPTWTTAREPIFIYDENGQPKESAWPERWTFKELLAKKKGYIERGQLSYWLREYECRIVSEETALLNIKFLKYYETIPEQMTVYAAIDPASSEAKDAHKTAIVFFGFHGGAAYLLDYYVARGKNPEEIWTAYLRLALKWRPTMTGIESISYQRVLAWYFREHMIASNVFFAIREVQDRRRKSDRITQAHSGRLYNGQLLLGRHHHEYIEALNDYTGEEDFDLLDAGAIALDLATPLMLENYIEGDYATADPNHVPLELTGGPP